MARNLISSDTALKARLKAITPNGPRPRINDGDGLYLRPFVKGHSHGWRFDYTLHGKRNTLSVGTYPDTGLADARRKADELRRMVANGEDPSTSRTEAKAQAASRLEAERLALAGLPAPGTFESVARGWLNHRSGAWEEKTLGNAQSSLERYVFPTIGSKPIASLKPADIRAVVNAVQETGASETAGRVFQRVKSICAYAVAHGLLDMDPTYPLKRSEIIKPYRVTHRPALPEKDLPSLLRSMSAYEGQPSTILALRLLALTVVRPGELRGARWAEFEVDAPNGPVWRVPAWRMKMQREHIVPLSRQAIAVLDEARKTTGGQGLVFPSAFYPDKPLSENTLNSALSRMGWKGSHTAHGFRALFSTIANERGKSADAIERQLAHIERNAVRAAYHRGEHIEERRSLMQWWADLLDAHTSGSKRLEPLLKIA